MRFIKANEKRQIVKELEIFGITKVPGMLIETGKEKVRGFSGSLSREWVQKLQDLARIEIIGLYLFKKENAGLRLSLDGSMMLPVEKFLDIKDDEVERWMKGEDLEIKIVGEVRDGLYVVRNDEDVLGVGALKDRKLINYIPKERRIRKS